MIYYKLNGSVYAFDTKEDGLIYAPEGAQEIDENTALQIANEISEKIFLELGFNK